MPGEQADQFECCAGKIQGNTHNNKNTLTGAEIEALSIWLDQGALDN
jgi:hypothetical protein